MRKLLFLPIFAFGITTYPDFSMCYNKYKNYSTIPISKNYSLSSQKPKNYVRFDEDLGIYLIKTHNKKYIHFKKSHLGVWIASIKKDSIYSGNYAEYQKSLFKPAKISSHTKPASIITDIFCNPLGVGVNGGFLSKSYITEFIKYKPKKVDYLKFLGILYDDNLVITKILPNTIASRKYISVGSKILKVNNKKIIKNKFPNQIKSVTILQEGIVFTIQVKHND